MEAGSDTEYAESHRDRVLFDLAKRDKSHTEETFRALTEAASSVLDVARVSVWRLTSDGTCIECVDLYDRAGQLHSSGGELHAEDYPEYFRAIRRHRVIAAHDVQSDPRTAELKENYLAPLGITSMMDVPIWREGKLYGVLCHEHLGPPRHWNRDEELFAANLAELVALSVEAGKRREVESRWKTVVEAISEAVFVLDANGTVIQTNPAGAALLRYTGGGRTISERRELFDLTDDNGRSLFLGGPMIPTSVSGHEIHGEIVHARIKKTGERKSFRLTTTPLTDDDRVRGAVMVLADVTEEVYVETLKRELLSALAHELKTPVTIVKGYVQHLAQMREVPDRGRPMLSAIERAANRLERLIEDLIQVSGLRMGRLTLERNPADLVELVRGVVARASSTLDESHFIHVEAPPGRLLVNADKPRMQQLIRRLIDNAIRYSPNGGEILVGLTRSDHHVILSVQDHGVGIPIKDQPHIFEMFFRAHAHTPYDVGGLGIGLFLARELARRHDGEMWFESVEGKGSTFFLRLPLAI